ncbi:hypothetical protein CQA67_33405, partial [Klebsiella pneumoniae]
MGAMRRVYRACCQDRLGQEITFAGAGRPDGKRDRPAMGAMRRVYRACCQDRLGQEITFAGA